MAASLSPAEQQKVVSQYRGLRAELETLYNKLGVVDADRSEHELVIKQMSELDGGRRCWQQIGPVLAEKNVTDVLPVLSENRTQLAAAVKMLTETITKKESDMQELAKKYNIREGPPS